MPAAPGTLEYFRAGTILPAGPARSNTGAFDYYRAGSAFPAIVLPSGAGYALNLSASIAHTAAGARSVVLRRTLITGNAVIARVTAMGPGIISFSRMIPGVVMRDRLPPGSAMRDRLPPGSAMRDRLPPGSATSG